MENKQEMEKRKKIERLRERERLNERVLVSSVEEEWLATPGLDTAACCSPPCESTRGTHTRARTLVHRFARACTGFYLASSLFLLANSRLKLFLSSCLGLFVCPLYTLFLSFPFTIHTHSCYLFFLSLLAHTACMCVRWNHRRSFLRIDTAWQNLSA